MAARTPAVIDTDVGGDPDDVVAILAFLRSRSLAPALAVTADEKPGFGRFRLLRRVVDLCGGGGRMRLFAGLQGTCGESKFVCDALLTDEQRRPEGKTEMFDSFCAALRGLVAANELVCYVAIGGLANLAEYLARYPGDAPRIRVVAMVGDLTEGREARVTWNAKLAPAAAAAVLGNTGLAGLVIVPTDATRLSPKLPPADEIAGDADVAAACSRAGAPGLVGVVRENFRAYAEQLYPESRMHDPLAVAVADGRVRAEGGVLVRTDQSGAVSRGGDGARAAGVVRPAAVESMTDFWAVVLGDGDVPAAKRPRKA